MIESVIVALVIVSLILIVIKPQNLWTRDENKEKAKKLVNEFIQLGVTLLEVDNYHIYFLEECINSGFNLDEFDDVHDEYHRMALQYEILKGYYTTKLEPLHKEEYIKKKSLYSKKEQRVIDLVYYNISMLYHLVDTCIEIHDKNIQLSEEYKNELCKKLKISEKIMDELKKVISKTDFIDIDIKEEKYSTAHK